MIVAAFFLPASPGEPFTSETAWRFTRSMLEAADLMAGSFRQAAANLGLLVPEQRREAS